MSRNRRGYGKGKSNPKPEKRGKEMEVNIDDASVNKADLPRKGKKYENDFEWYNHYRTLLAAVTGINYGQPLGSAIGLNGPGTFNNASGTPIVGTAAYSLASISGLMSIGFVPTLGAATNVQDSVANKVAVQLYSAMRMKLGSTASYEPVDIMMYIGAMDSAFDLYAVGVMIYGCLRMSSPFNYYFLQPLQRALGCDFSSFLDHIEDFRAFVNRYAIYLSSLQVPADFDVFKRHVWMLTNIFTDSNTAKAQMYLYRLDGYYTYEEQTTGGTYLKFNATPATTLWTYETYMAACESVMSKLLGSSDVTQMSADIGKAFENDTFVLSAIPEEYITPVSFSSEVLSQFENAMLLGNPLVVSNADYTPVATGYNTWDIYQDNSLNLTNPQIRQFPLFAGPAGADQVKANYLQVMSATPLLNFHKQDVTNADTIVATRGVVSLINYSMLGSGSTLLFGPVYYGTEIYTIGRIITIGAGGPFGNDTNVTILKYINEENNATAAGLISSLWSQFDWAPTIYVVDGNQSGGYTTFCRLQDTDIYARVDSTQIRDMHTAAVLSEFYSPKFPQLHE